MNASTGGLAVHHVGPAAMAERAVALIGDRLAGGTDPHEVAVLARVNSALLPVQVALTEAGIAHTAPLDATVLGRTGVRTALAYLRLGLDLDRIRREDLFDTINRPARKVKSAVQPLLGRRGRFSIAQLDQVTDSLDPTHRDRFAEYLGDLRTLEAEITAGGDTASCLAIVRHRIGLGEAMDALDASRTRPEGSSHGDDLDALEQLAALQPDPASFREWLTERLRVPADPHGVTLSSVHRVKGMEWPHVVVFAANQGLFPHRLADDVEEERRVFHVAVTRCQQQVDVVADRARTSPFVAELSRPSERPEPGARSDDRTPSRTEATVRDDGAVVAAPGIELTLTGGLTGTVTTVASDHAVVLMDPPGPGVGDGAGAGDGHVAGEGGRPGADGEPGQGTIAVTTRVPFGAAVRVAGRAATLVKAAPRRATPGAATAGAGSGRLVDAGDEPDVDDALYEALRAWRARIAAETGVPAYLVFHDRHLRLISGRKPQSLRDLAACPGVGPTKLERYGDDVLDLVAAHPD